MKNIVKLLLALILANSTTLYATSVTDMANKNGIKACGNQIKVIADFMIKDRTHVSRTIVHKNAPDKRMFDAMTIMSYSDVDSHISITASPNPAGKCDAAYVETFVQKGSCVSARENIFSNWKFAGNLNGSTTMLKNTKNGTVNIYLTPQLSNTVCMVTKREVVYESNKSIGSSHSGSPVSQPKSEPKVKVYKEETNVNIGYTSYVVWRSWWSNRLSDNKFLVQKPDAKFLFVELTVKNDDKKARSIAPFKLIDENGAEYEASSKAWAVKGFIGVLTSLNPGVKKRGFIVFDVPTEHKYKLKISGGYWSGKNAFIQLSPKVTK